MKQILVATILLFSSLVMAQPHIYGDSHEGWNQGFTLTEIVSGLISWGLLIWFGRWAFERWVLGWWGVVGFYSMHVLMFYVLSGLSEPLWLIAIISIFATIFSLVVLNEF